MGVLVMVADELVNLVDQGLARQVQPPLDHVRLRHSVFPFSIVLGWLAVYCQSAPTTRPHEGVAFNRPGKYIR